MMTITTKTLWTRRGVRWARRDLLLLLLLACLGPPLVVSQGGHDVMPATSFSCIGKVIGGYYADVEAGCQMFHVCTLNEKAKVHDYTFRCLAGTVFDQETRVCERTDEVDCSRSRSFYYLNNDLYGPGIIPSTADSEGSASAAKMQVLDPTVALMGSPHPPTIPPKTLEPTTTPSPVSQLKPKLHPSLQPHFQPLPQPHPQTQPWPPPTSSPPPPTIPHGVTASTTRMSTSTSSSVTAAYSFPSLPYTVSHTSTSVSASSRVRIQTPLAQISLNQGIDHSILPAPHLRPSLLRLAAEAQNAAQAAKILDGHHPTAPPQFTAQTPANFQDVPRLSVFHLDTSGTSATTAKSSIHRLKRQLTPQTQSFSPSITPLSDSATSSRLTNRDHSQSSVGAHRTTSRGRNRFRQPRIHDGPTTTRPQANLGQSAPSRHPVQRTSARHLGQHTSSRTLVQGAPSRGPVQGTPSRSRQSSQTQVQQRTDTSPARQSAVQFSFSQQFRPATDTNRFSPVVTTSSDIHAGPRQVRVRVSPPTRPQQAVRSQQARPQQVLGSHQAVRPEQVFIPQHSVRPQGVLTPQQVDITEQAVRHRPAALIPTQVGRASPQERPFPALDSFPSTTTSPTQMPPTVLTAKFPSDSHIRVIDEGEERQRTVGQARTADISTTTTTTPAPRFVFPETSFSCVDKILGGLYADVELGCAVFHICSVEPNAGVKDNKFECGRGTLFDQSTRTCQIAALVDCAAAPSFYYLNDRHNLPVSIALQPQHPEQLFDFPRLSSSPLSPTSAHSPPSIGRGRRSADGSSVDLCRSRALGSPLADITTGCQYYTVCQAGEGGKLVESRVACKKDFLFSQLQKRCVSAKKVNCAKETLSEILGLGGHGEGRSRKRRMASILQSRRFRRAALAPLINLVTAPGVEDARVRRALYNLAALQEWTLENARQSTFIEVYAQQTDRAKNRYPKKVYLNPTSSWDSSEAGHVYQNIQRKKRDVSNMTVAKLIGNKTKGEDTHDQSLPEDLSQPEQTQPEQINLDITHSFSSSIVHPTIVTTTIGQRTSTLSTSTVLGQRGSSTTNPTTPPLPPLIPTTLSTYTVSPSRTSTTTVTVTPITPVTVTVTTTKIITTATDLPPDLFPTSTSIAKAATQSPEPVTTPLPETSSTLTGLETDDKTTTTPSSQITSSKDASSDNGIHTTKSPETSTVPIPVPQEESPEDSTTTTTTGTSQSSVASEGEAHEASEEGVTESAIDGLIEPQESPVDTSAAVTEGNETSMPMSTSEAAQSSEVSTINSTTITTTNSTPVTPEDTTPKFVQNTTITTPINATTASSTTESSVVTVPSGSINMSTTETPNMSASGNISITPSTESSVTPQGPFTSENLPKTNFTCKGKKLEQFYPDPEANCQVFHYCSPGFVKKQVLDLKFLCTGATMFDLYTQKCEDMSSVTCGQEPTPPPPPANTTTTPEGTSVAPHDAAQNETSTTKVPNNITSKVTANVVTDSTTPSNTSELLNVTTEMPTVVTTLESTTVVSQLNVTTEKETNWNATESEHHTNATESKHHKNITESEHHTNATESEHHTNATESEHHTNATESEQHTNATESEHHTNVTESEQHTNVTESEHHKNATESKDETIETKVTTEESIPETITITEDHHLIEPEEKTAEIDQPESTTVKATEEPASETEVPATEVATEEGTKDEVVTATESYEDVLVTSLSPEEVLIPEISTELGPLIHPEVVEETKSIAEEVTQVPAATEMNIDSVSGTSTLYPSMSVLQETSTEVSVSTDVSVFSSTDSISSESSMSSAVSVSSHNITTPSSVEPLEASV